MTRAQEHAYAQYSQEKLRGDVFHGRIQYKEGRQSWTTPVNLRRALECSSYEGCENSHGPNENVTSEEAELQPVEKKYQQDLPNSVIWWQRYEDARDHEIWNRS